MVEKSDKTQRKHNLKELLIVLIVMAPLLPMMLVKDRVAEKVLEVIWPTSYLITMVCFVLIKLLIIGMLISFFVSDHLKRAIHLLGVSDWLVVIFIGIFLLSFGYDFQVIPSMFAQSVPEDKIPMVASDLLRPLSVNISLLIHGIYLGLVLSIMQIFKARQ